MRHEDGSVQFSGEEPRLFKTCMFSTYMDDYMPAIMREINSLYDVDCFYTNGWPPLGSLPECHCAICSKLPPSGNARLLARLQRSRPRALANVRRHRQREEARQLLLRQLRRQRARRPQPRSPRQNRCSGSRATTRDAPTKSPPSGDAACRAASATPCWMASWPPTSPPPIPPAWSGWRNASKNPEEARMWLSRDLGQRHGALLPLRRLRRQASAKTAAGRKSAPTISAGRRATMPISPPRRSIANIGVVIGQSTQLLYPGPATAHSRALHARDHAGHL